MEPRPREARCVWLLVPESPSKPLIRTKTAHQIPRWPRGDRTSEAVLVPLVRLGERISNHAPAEPRLDPLDLKFVN